MSGAAVVVGAGGALGRALVAALVAREEGPVHALSRAGAALPGAVAGRLDVTDAASVEAAAQAVDAPVTRLFIATGVLQGGAATVERRLADLAPEALAESFRVNAIGPALVMRAFAPRLPREKRAVVAALSARVGSIGDNRLGGWYGYRASKAALNMMVRCLAVELARTHPLAVCAALHPGTVDTGLSRPFQRGLPPGQLQTPEAAAARLLAVADALTPAQSGGFFGPDGAEISY